MENKIKISDETVFDKHFESDLFTYFPERLHPTVKKLIPEFWDALVDKSVDIGSFIDAVYEYLVHELEYDIESFKTAQKFAAVEAFVNKGGIDRTMYENEIKAEINRGARGLLARFLGFHDIKDPEKAIVAFVVWKNTLTGMELSRRYDLDTKCLHDPEIDYAICTSGSSMRAIDFSQVFSGKASF
jgi:hypothetical protein